MKAINRTAFGAALGMCLGALFAATPAQAHDTYVKGELGGGFADKYDNVTNGDLDSNWRWGVGVGTSVTQHFRLEGEYIHDSADFKTGGGSTHANLGMANAYYDFGNTMGLTPFVGAGVGGGRFSADGLHDTGMAYQLTAGASKPLTSRLTGELAYKFLDAPNLTFGGTDTSYRSSFITAALRLKFGG